MGDEGVRADINRLYWETDASVNEIAERLGVSRRGLYDEIEPRPAGRDCPECGGDLGFRNRTALAGREATCAECGVERVLGAAEPASAGSHGEAAGTAPGPARGAVREALPAWEREVPLGDALLGGAVLAGLALGAAVGFLLRRR